MDDDRPCIEKATHRDSREERSSPTAAGRELTLEQAAPLEPNNESRANENGTERQQ